MGVIEPTAAESFNNFLERETEYLESMREHLFVVMGAGLQWVRSKYYWIWA